MALNEKLFEIHVDLTWGEFSQRIDISSNQTRLGLMGPTGCGKTTLVKELLGISQRAKGQICFQQRTLLDSDQKIFVDPWLRSFAYAPQDFQLMPHLSVKENILFADQSRFNDDVVQELGLKKILGRFPGHLSGGEKQRVALARALCQTSRLLILDEPFSALDKESRKRCLSFVDEYTRNLSRPMLIISHGQQELEAMNCETFQISSAQ